MPIPSDTSNDAEQAQLQLLREKSPRERAALAVRLSSEVIQASKRAIARAHPEFTAPRWAICSSNCIMARHSPTPSGNTKGCATMAGPSDLTRALRPVLTELDRLGVRYCVGGSIASSVHGAARSTLDADLAAELDEPTAMSLIAALQNDYYASEIAAREAVRNRSCFNLLHLATSFKIDIFVSRGREFDRSVQARAITDVLGGSDDVIPVRVASAEDIILIKLEWYRLGDETSKRQWNDVKLVAKLQADRLDWTYLRHWAEELAVTDLLDRLKRDLTTRSEAGQ